MKELQQRVPIAKGFSVTFRTWSGEEDQVITKLLSDVSKEGDIVYARTLATIYELGIGVVGINDVVLPSHLTPERVFSEDLFKHKLAVLSRYPSILLVDMSVNLAWFRERVEALLLHPEKVKNG